jgi:hypothetical protein
MEQVEDPMIQAVVMVAHAMDSLKEAIMPHRRHDMDQVAMEV